MPRKYAPNQFTFPVLYSTFGFINANPISSPNLKAINMNAARNPLIRVYTSTMGVKNIK
jgi:hypothetical protein